MTRSELLDKYLESLPYAPYRVQEEAILEWFGHEHGVLVCAPTGTGKTLIAEAALFEALHRNETVYYTTPLIALTEQKFADLQAAAVRWGFRAADVGLVTGHRRVNPDARVLVVVAEVLLNRLLNPEQFAFASTFAVVMDEFHNFADAERGIVWELTLGLLPRHVRLLLLSATVGNAAEFLHWLRKEHGRDLARVEGTERRVPLHPWFVDNSLLCEHLEFMAEGGPAERKTPALVFCFNREECWSVAEQLKGLDLLGPGERAPLTEAVEALPWTRGVGPKLRQMLRRGVGVHHAGLLPMYRRVVEELFARKLLAICVCTETLAAGVNLPARSVVLPSLVKGPKGGKKLLDASGAHQIFGRAGRPQFDTEGHVFALAHEDDVKILRWKVKFDQIPENTKDPGLLAARKALRRKQPTRRTGETYWTREQFDKLVAAPPGKLYSKGPIPWRVLAHWLAANPDLAPLRKLCNQRLLDEPRKAAGIKRLHGMLKALHAGEFVRLDPPPPAADDPAAADYFPATATPLYKLRYLTAFRTMHPVYAAFLVEQLAIADPNEKLQALESVLDIPRSALRLVRVPDADEVPTGPLESTRLDPELLTRGLIKAIVPPSDDDDEDDEPRGWEERPPRFAEKLRLWFDVHYPDVQDFTTLPVWAGGELLRFDGDFDRYVRTRDLAKQEGIVFRHCLRLAQLCEEFARMPPAEVVPEDWAAEFRGFARKLADSCRAVDPQSVDEALKRTEETELA